MARFMGIATVALSGIIMVGFMALEHFGLDQSLMWMAFLLGPALMSFAIFE